MRDSAERQRGNAIIKIKELEFRVVPNKEITIPSEKQAIFG